MSELYFRIAEEKDARLLFDWANDRSVRDNSFSTEPIALDEHMAWFKNAIDSKNIKIFIFLKKVTGEPIGQVRLTFCSDHAVIGYSVAAEHRGNGYGKEMIRMVGETVKREYPQIKELIAEIKPGNVASRKIFEGLEYSLDSVKYTLLL